MGDSVAILDSKLDYLLQELDIVHDEDRMGKMRRQLRRIRKVSLTVLDFTRHSRTHTYQS